MSKRRTTVLAMAFIAMICLAIGDIQAEAGTAQELEWTDLIPKGFNPDEIFEQYQKKYNIDELPDDDPRLVELTNKLNEMWKSSPVNMALNGKVVKLPGYVVPLETDGRKSSQFLLVPYYGACIHVPPPPANQTVYVTTQDKKGAAIRKMFDVVWVTGMMKAEKLSTDMADAGYTIDAIKVEPYE